MPSVFIVWKAVKGKYIPTTMYSCDKCGTRYEKEEDADACENRRGDPKFKPGDKVVMKYDDETSVMTHVEDCDQIRDYTMTVKTVKAVKAPDWADAHWYDYECELPGNRIIELHERELRRS